MAKILIASDTIREGANKHLVQDMNLLMHAGHTVEIVYGLAQAKARIKNDAFDVLIAAANHAPEPYTALENLWDLLETVKTEAPDTKCLALRTNAILDTFSVQRTDTLADTVLTMAGLRSDGVTTAVSELIK